MLRQLELPPIRLRKAPRKGSSLRLDGGELIKKGKEREAEAAYKVFLRRFPRHRKVGEIWFRLGELYFLRQRKQAIFAYRKALKMLPASHRMVALVLYKLAWSYYLQERYPEAIAFFVKLLRHKQNHQLKGEAIQYLVFSYVEKKYSVRQVLAIHRPESAALRRQILVRWSQAYRDMAQWSRAIVVVRAALQVDPDARQRLDLMMYLSDLYRRAHKSRRQIESLLQLVAKCGPGSRWLSLQMLRGERSPPIFASLAKASLHSLVLMVQQAAVAKDTTSAQRWCQRARATWKKHRKLHVQKVAHSLQKMLSVCGRKSARLPSTRPLPGSLPTHLRHDTLRSRLRNVQACYENQLRSSPHLRGKVVWQIVLTIKGGQPRSVRVVSASPALRKQSFVACITRLFRRIWWPAATGGDATILVPLVFAPSR